MPFLTQGKTNWKYILIVVILAVIAGGGIFSYLKYFEREIESLPNFPEIKRPEKIVKEETADWKTYRNEEYGLEIKYPTFVSPSTTAPASYLTRSAWTSRPERGSKGEVIASFVTCEFSNIPSVAPYYSFTSELRIGASSDPNDVKNCLNFWNLPSENVNINGKEFKKFKTSDAAAGHRANIEVYRTIHNGICFSIEKLEYGYLYDELENPSSSHYNLQDSKRFNSCRKITEQMLSTFKFIADETANWKTYKSSEMGFSIKYPREWGDFKEEIYPQDIFGLDVRATLGRMDEIFLYFRRSKIAKETFEEFIKNYTIPPKLNVTSEIEKDNLTLDGMLAIKITYTWIPEGSPYSVLNEEVYTEKNGDLYMIQASINYQKKDIYLPIFNQMLSTFRFIETETANWKTYKNEKYGLEFQYPGKWFSLTFKSQINDNIYLFSSQNESIGSIYYYKPLKILSFIEKGGEVECVYRGQCFQKTLKIIYPSKEIKVIHSTSLDQARWYADIDSVNFSPDGKYICFILSMYEFSQPYLINIESGLNILKDHNIWFDDPYKNLYWSPNNKVLAIRSYINELTAKGIDSLFVSDYDNPEKLNEVFSFSAEEHYMDSRIYDIYFSNDNELFFTVLSKKCKYVGKLECEPEKITKYEYIVQTKELKEIKE